MSIYRIRNKTISRIAAIQVIYQHSQKDQVEEISSLLQKIVSFYHSENLESHLKIKDGVSIKAKLSMGYLDKLINHTITNLVLIDDLISKNLGLGWQVKDMPLLLLSILRVSICELKFFPETPKKVVINEFTDIASDMLSDSEIGFVNSILDNIAKEA